MDDSLKKFQDLLREIFQFEATDLDFGIYRILNFKRELINTFINDGMEQAAFPRGLCSTITVSCVKRCSTP